MVVVMEKLMEETKMQIKMDVPDKASIIALVDDIDEPL